MFEGGVKMLPPMGLRLVLIVVVQIDKMVELLTIRSNYETKYLVNEGND